MQISHPSLESNSISIVCAADDNFVMGLAVTLYSTLVNIDSNHPIDIYILDGGISNQNKYRLNRVIRNTQLTLNLKWLEPDVAALKGVKVTRSFTLAACFRLLLPELLPTEVERVIYLDSDLVVEGNLAELWKEKLGDSPALGVQDFLYPYGSKEVQNTYRELHLPSDTLCCNSGVMVINLKQWRIESLGHQVLDYIRRNHDVVYLPDQDGINAIIGNRWKYLDPKWNVQIFGANKPTIKLPYESNILIRDAFILHFTTSVKPWHSLYRQPGGKRFAHYLKNSNWFNLLEYIIWFNRIRLPQILIYFLANLKRNFRIT